MRAFISVLLLFATLSAHLLVLTFACLMRELVAVLALSDKRLSAGGGVLVIEVECALQFVDDDVVD